MTQNLSKGNGSVALSVGLSEDSATLKKALLCRTGKFDGMYGEVTVTEQLLQGIADRYNEERKTPQNKNDYVPVLTDHVREVDRIKGRIMPDLEVLPWTNPGDGVEEFGLFGSLRIDSEDAKTKVADGTYAQLSISFDEETFELFEVSFVSVEAARRSMVLSTKKPQGGDRMQKKNLAQLEAKHKALTSAVGENRKKRKQALSALMKKATALQTEIVALEVKSKEIALTVKTGQIKGKFHSFVKGGKMSPAEVKALDVKSLAALNDTALTIVLGAYESRPVSTDVNQYGQKADKKVVLDLSPGKMREAMALQKSGKGVSLSEEDKEDEDDKADKNLENDEESKEDAAPMSSEDMAACMEEMEGHHAKLSEAMVKMKAICESMKSLSDDEDKDEEKELAADEDKEEKEKEEDKNKKEGEE